MNLKPELDKLAQMLVDKANQKDAPLADLLDTFKELRAYHAMNLKHAPPPDEEGEGGFSFDNGIGAGDGAGVHRRRSS